MKLVEVIVVSPLLSIEILITESKTNNYKFLGLSNAGVLQFIYVGDI